MHLTFRLVPQEKIRPWWHVPPNNFIWANLSYSNSLNLKSFSPLLKTLYANRLLLNVHQNLY